MQCEAALYAKQLSVCESIAPSKFKVFQRNLYLFLKKEVAFDALIFFPQPSQSAC